MVLVGGRDFCRGGGRGWYVGGQSIVIVVEGTDAVFYEGGAVRPPVAVVFVFLVCGDVVVVSVMTEVYARRRGGRS